MYQIPQISRSGGRIGIIAATGKKPFDAIVSNPPYSINWIGSDDPTLINDERFAPAGVLAPKSKADFAFILHSLNYLSSRGGGRQLYAFRAYFIVEE